MSTDWKSKLPQYWAKLAALFGAVLVLLNALVGLDFWSETIQQWINVAISSLVAVAVWLKRNVNVVERAIGVDIDQDKDVGVEGGVISTDKPLTAQQRADVEAAWRAKHGSSPPPQAKHREGG